MKTLKQTKGLIAIFLTLTLFYCSNDSNLNKESDSELSAKFSSYLSKYDSSNNYQKTVELYSQLDFSSNYENSIFRFITKDESYDENDSSIYSSNLGYAQHTEFDRDFFMSIISEFNTLDATSFFLKVNYLKDFVEKEVSDITQKDYLLSSLEELKWVKYSIHSVQNSSSYARNNGDACFDACMERSIEEQFDWWGGWIQFAIAPGPVVAWMAGECINKCYF